MNCSACRDVSRGSRGRRRTCRRSLGSTLCVIKKASTVHGSLVVRFVINLVGDTAVVQEALNAVHVATLAVVAHQLDELAITGSPQDQGTRLFLSWGRNRVIRDARHEVARNVANRFAGGFSGRTTVACRSVGSAVCALGEAGPTDRLRVKLRVAQQPHLIVATVGAIHHSVWGGVRRFRKARLRVDSGTSTGRH
jgi:hypothetical protein